MHLQQHLARPRQEILVAALIGTVAAAACFLPLANALALVAALVVLPLVWHAFAVRWVPMYLGAAILLPPLPLGIGDSGPNPAVLVAGVGLLAGIARAREWRLEFSTVHVALLAYLTTMVLSLGSALIHSGMAIATASAARVALFGIGIYVFFASANGPERLSPVLRDRAARMIHWIALAAAAFGCVDFAFQLPAPAGFEPQFLWLDSGVYRRAQGLFYEASTLGNFCAFFLVMAGVMLSQPKESRLLPTWALWLGIPVFAGALMLSFSRAPVLACALSLGALFVLNRHRQRALVVFAGMLLMGAVAVLIALPEVAAGYWGRFVSIGTRLLEMPDRVLSGRLESWSTLAAFIFDHPWQTLVGIGYKTLPYTEHLGQPIIADNAYLSALVELGVAGLLALLALNTAILVTGWRAAKQGSFYGRWIFCFWIGEVFQMLTGDILTYWRVLPLYFWVLAQAYRDLHADSAGRPIR